MPATALAPPDRVEVYLLRHGQTAWNVERRFLGASDVPLDDVGRAQANQVAAYFQGLRPYTVYSSPLSRALETARALGPPRVVAGLAEMNMGALEGLSAEACTARWPELLPAWRDAPAEVTIPGGETLAAVQTRILAAFRGLVAAHRPGERLVVVTHQLALSSLLCGLAGRTLSEFRSFGHRNCAYTRILVGAAVDILEVDRGDHLTA